MSSWREVHLGDVCEFSNGANFTKDSFGPGVKIIGVGDFGDRLKPDWRTVGEVKPSAVTSERQLLRDGDVVFVRSNGNRALVGRSMLVDRPDGATHSAFTIRARPNQEVVRPRFLAYQLRHVHKTGGMSAASGTNITNLNQSILHNIKLRLPCLEAQDRVVEALGSIDDLIDNNRWRTEVLEEMAQAIYREWFVHFRFPGHEDATFVDSSVGPIPEGWATEPLSAVAEVTKGLSYKGSFLTDDGVPMVNLKCLRPQGGFRRDGTKPYSGPAKPKHQIGAGDIVMANTDLTQAGGVIGSSAIVPRKGFESGGIISHHVFVVRPRNRLHKHWLVDTFNDGEFRQFARGVASGTTVLGLRANDVLDRLMAVPPASLAEEYDAICSGLTAFIESLHESSLATTSLRDLLLPKLVTGEIDVSDLDLDALVEAI